LVLFDARKHPPAVLDPLAENAAGLAVLLAAPAEPATPDHAGLVPWLYVVFSVQPPWDAMVSAAATVGAVAVMPTNHEVRAIWVVVRRATPMR
jgi:hypothetical protein